MQKYKVAVFIEKLVDGLDHTSHPIFQLIKRIPKNDFDFIFFCTAPQIEDVGYDVVQVPYFKIPFDSTLRIGLPYFNKKKIETKLDKFCPDVIHFQSPISMSFSVKKYALEHNIPVVSIYHAPIISSESSLSLLKPYFNKLTTNLIKRFYHDLNIVYVATKFIKDELSTKYGFDKPNLKLWNSEIDLELFSQRINDADLQVSEKIDWDHLAAIYFQDLKKLSGRIITRFDRGKQFVSLN